jgi:hypothetical protein
MITLNNLPEIADSKTASYQDEPVIGRSFPIKTYSHSENRTVTMKVHFITLTAADATTNMVSLRALQSAVYPKDQVIVSPYLPPPVCKIRCGNLLSGKASDGWVCVILKQYSVNFPTDVAWMSDEQGNGTYLPYKFDVDLTWDVVYSNENLPGQEMIMKDY